MFPRALTL
jgi:hypothetical protein